jgi:hypothetical protein
MNKDLYILARMGSATNFLCYLAQKHYVGKRHNTFVCPITNEYSIASSCTLDHNSNCIPYMFKRWIWDNKWHYIATENNNPGINISNMHIMLDDIDQSVIDIIGIRHDTKESIVKSNKLYTIKKQFGTSVQPNIIYGVLTPYLNTLNHDILCTNDIMNQYKNYIKFLKSTGIPILATSRIGLAYFIISLHNKEPYKKKKLVNILKQTWDFELNQPPSNNEHLYSPRDHASPNQIISYEQLMNGDKTNTIFDNYKDEILAYDSKNNQILKYWDNLLK